MGVKMSVMNSEKLNIQTTWNTEMPYEAMVGLKKQVPTVMKMVSDPAVGAYSSIRRQAKSLMTSTEPARKQGKELVTRAFERLAAVNPPPFVVAVTDKTIVMLKDYQKKLEVVLDAVITFLRETKFQIPGFEQKLSGLELYQKYTAFVADVSEEAVQKIPEYFASMFKVILDYVKATEFTFPGSNYVVRGEEIIDDLVVALKKIQDQVIIIVRKLSDMTVEDMTKKISAFMQFTIKQSENLLQTLKSQNVEKLFTSVTDMYNDFITSPVMADVTQQVGEAYKTVLEYLKAVKAKLHKLFVNMSGEKLQADVQLKIDQFVKCVSSCYSSIIKTVSEKSRNVKQFVRVSERQVEVDIPLPVIPKFN